jgi:hypothetical protein
MYPDIEQKHGITFKQANDLLRELLARHQEGLSILAAWGLATERARELERELAGVVAAYDRTANCMSPEGHQEMQHELWSAVEGARSFLLPNRS